LLSLLLYFVKIAVRTTTLKKEDLMASEAAVLEMEKKAVMRKRMNKAQAEFNANNTVHAQNVAREQADNNVMREAASSAHERFMQSRRQFIERNPNAVSPFEFAATMGYKRGEQNPAALRAHELNMLREKNAGEIAVAEKKAQGMENQGRAAAEIGAKTDMHKTDTTLKQHELEMANRKDIAGIQSETQKSLAEGQNKTMLENTKLQGENAVKQQSEANKGLLAQSELKEKMEKEKLDNSLQTAIIKANAGLNAQQAKNHATIIGNAIRAGAQSGKDIATVLTELKETYKNDAAMLKSLGGIGDENSGDNGGGGPKKGDRRQVKGGYAVYDGSKWVMEK
jgi:hypothetical protein